MVCVCFSPVTDHCAWSQTQHACVQPVVVIIVVNINIMIMMIINVIIIIMIPIMPTWSWESIQISSEQGRVAGEKSSCGIEQTLLIVKSLQHAIKSYLAVEIGVVVWVPLVDAQQLLVQAPARPIFSIYVQLHSPQHCHPR